MLDYLQISFAQVLILLSVASIEYVSEGVMIENEKWNCFGAFLLKCLHTGFF